MVSRNIEVFCKEIRRHKGSNAIFDFTRPDLRLGDYGTLTNGVFTYQGNALDDGFLTSSEIDPQNETKIEGGVYTHWSDGVRTMDGSTIVKTDPASAEFKFKFVKDNQFFYTTNPVKTKTLKKFRDIERKLRMHLGNDWKKEYCLVTSITYSKPTKLIIGSKAGSVINAKGSVSKALSQLIDVAFSFDYKSNSSSVQIHSRENQFTSMFQVRKFRKKSWLSGDVMLSRGFAAVKEEPLVLATV